MRTVYLKKKERKEQQECMPFHILLQYSKERFFNFLQVYAIISDVVKTELSVVSLRIELYSVRGLPLIELRLEMTSKVI